MWGFLVLAVSALALFVLVKRSRARAGQLAGPTERVLEGYANYIGRASSWASVGGLGYLVLTREELVFAQCGWPRTFAIPVRDLLTADRARSFRSRRSSGGFLVIGFRCSDTDHDEIAFSVRCIDEWLRHLPSSPSESAPE